MTNQPNDNPNASADEHAEMRERIEAYLAGGLSDSERNAFEAHVQTCVACDAELTAARALAERLTALFAEESPSADFEERLIGRLRAERGPNLEMPAARSTSSIAIARGSPADRRAFWLRPLPFNIHPAVRNAGLATAATVALGLVGYFATASPWRSDRSSSRQNTFNTQVDLLRDSGSGWALGSIQRDDRTSHTRQLGLSSASIADGDGSDRWIEKSKDAGRSAGSGGGGKSTVDEPELKLKAAKLAITVPVPDGDKLQLGRQTVNGRLDNNALNYSFQPSLLDVAKLGDVKQNDSETLKKLSESPPQAELERLRTEAVEEGRRQSAMRIAKDPKAEERRAMIEANAQLADGHEKPASASTPPANTPPASTQKIIRTGEMQFQVERFDAAVDQVAKIVSEEGGYVGTTDSDKLANGKVRGTVTIRVAPERLDTVVLKLRGIGDLKSQKINAQDITRQYTDLESGLRAARAMEDRLLEIIKTGKGEVKDLLEAEKQLGVWREKIEQIEGEIRYDNSQVAMSTLVITLEEKDIRSPAYATTSEQVTMALETPDVEQAYGKARDAIIAAKGRITQSDLKQFDAGQFGATIGAELPPDQADALIGRLKQLDGRVANFQRATSVVSHAPDTGVDLNAPIDAARQQRDNVKLSLTMYNLANIAPRRTITLSIAAANVDEAYRKLLDSTSALTTRVVASNIDRPRPEQASANLTLQAPTDKAEALLATLRAMGEVVRMETTDNPDTQNVTEAKRGFQVQIFSLASATARHTEQLQLAVPDVPATFADLLSQLSGAEARIVSSQLNQQDRENINGSIEFETSRSKYEALRPTLLKAGDVVSRVVGASQDTQNTVDSKIHVSLSLLSSATQPPRQTTTLGVEVNDVTRATGDWIAAAAQAGGRATGPTDVSHDRDGKAVAHVEVEVPLSQASAMIETARKLGALRALQTDVDAHVSEGKLSRAKLNVTFANSAATLGGAQSTGEAVREAFGLSGAALRWCIKLLVVGLCFVAPIVLIIWMVWKLMSALRGKRRARGAVIAS